MSEESRLLEEMLWRAARVAPEAEVYWLSSRSTPVLFHANRLKEIESREVTGVALRLILDGRVGFSSTTGPGDIQGVVDRAAEAAPFGPPARFQFPDTQAYPPVEIYDPRAEQTALDSVIQLGQGLIDEIRRDWPDLLCDVGVGHWVGRMAIVNSQGLSVAYSKSTFYLSVEGTLVRGTDMLFVGDSESSCQPIQSYAAVRDSMLLQLERARNLVPSPQGQVPVLFSARAIAGVLLGPLLSGLNGRTVLQRASPLAGRLGDRVLDQRFTLVDDPLQAWVPGSRPCDDEGVPSQVTPLVQEGVVQNFLYDLQTAGEAGTRTTASASRGLGSLPSPSPEVLLISPGDVSEEELLATVQDGLLVEQMLGAGQGNMLAGDFSANVLLGYRIQRGKVVGRVKDTMIAGNTYTALNGVLGVSQEARWVGGFLYAPSLLCRGVSVAARG